MENEGPEGARLPLTTSGPPSTGDCGVGDARWPRTTAAPLSAMVCTADGGCLPRTTTVPLSEVSDGADSDCLPLTTALPISKTAGCGGDGGWTSAFVLLANGGCSSEGALLPPSGAVLLTTGVSGADRSWATGPATLATGSMRVA